MLKSFRHAQADNGASYVAVVGGPPTDVHPDQLARTASAVVNKTDTVPAAVPGPGARMDLLKAWPLGGASLRLTS